MTEEKKQRLSCRKFNFLSALDRKCCVKYYKFLQSMMKLNSSVVYTVIVCCCRVGSSLLDDRNEHITVF